MKRVGVVLLILVSWMLAAGARAPIIVFSPRPLYSGPDNLSGYKAADGGRLVLSIAASVGARPVTGFYIAFVKLDGGGEGHLQSTTGTWMDPRFKEDNAPPSPADFGTATGEAATQYVGAVIGDQLPPGRYMLTAIRLDNFGYNQTIGPLRVPFEIQSGHTTYLGEIRAFEDWRHRGFLGGRETVGWRLTMTDKGTRDLPIYATKKKIDLGSVDSQVFDPQSLGKAYLSNDPRPQTP